MSVVRVGERERVWVSVGECGSVPVIVGVSERECESV